MYRSTPYQHLVGGGGNENGFVERVLNTLQQWVSSPITRVCYFEANVTGTASSPVTAQKSSFVDNFILPPAPRSSELAFKENIDPQPIANKAGLGGCSGKVSKFEKIILVLHLKVFRWRRRKRSRLEQQEQTKRNENSIYLKRIHWFINVVLPFCCQSCQRRIIWWWSRWWLHAAFTIWANRTGWDKTWTKRMSIYRAHRGLWVKSKGPCWWLNLLKNGSTKFDVILLNNSDFSRRISK